MNEHVISIVTPSFNQGEFVEDTIQSVLKQEGDFFIDYLIMDGGSSDESVAIIKKYEDLLRQNCTQKIHEGNLYYVSNNNDFEWNKCSGISFRWVSERDGGQVNAINTGFDKSLGIFFTWINSDDYYLNPNVIDLIVKIYNLDSSLLLISGDGVVVDRKGEKIWAHKIGRINLKELIYLDYHILQPSTFVHRDLHNKHKLNNLYKSTFDVDYFIAILSGCKKFLKIEDEIAAFRMYGENITSNKKLKMRAFRERIKIMKKYSSNNKDLFIGYVYQFFMYIVQPKFENIPLLNILSEYFIKFFKNFCYNLVINENYSKRYEVTK
jgi:glycosyltransferase involved in cell wall biosynthesis